MSLFRNHPHGPLSRRDAGVTLVELLIYMILLGLVLSMIVGVIVMTMQRQHEVMSISQTNDDAQTIVNALDMATANATAIGAAPPSSQGASQLLITATRGTRLDDGADVYRCVGFYFDADSGKLHHINVPPGVPNATSQARVDHSLAQSWPVIAEGVSATPGRNVFDFTNVPRLETNFEIATTRDREPVTINRVIVPRGNLGSESRCGLTP